MSAPRAIVVKAPGTNCEIESREALDRAGAEAEILTTAELYAEPERLLASRIVVFAGGFAHGDDVASARVLANQLALRLGDTLRRFVDEEEGFVLGICNGFQALVKVGLLPRAPGEALRQRVSLVHNDSGHYECRWVRLRVETGPCRFLPPGEILEMPVGHGEGKLVFGDDWSPGDTVALRYVDEDGEPAAAYPANPNGSMQAIAGLCDATGRVLGLMPHPDRSYLPYHHPRWARPGSAPAEPGGAVLFRGLVDAAR